jgi:hypothetical protein
MSALVAGCRWYGEWNWVGQMGDDSHQNSSRPSTACNRLRAAPLTSSHTCQYCSQAWHMPPHLHTTGEAAICIPMARRRQEGWREPVPCDEVWAVHMAPAHAPVPLAGVRVVLVEPARQTGRHARQVKGDGEGGRGVLSRPVVTLHALLRRAHTSLYVPLRAPPTHVWQYHWSTVALALCTPWSSQVVVALVADGTTGI